MRFLPADWLRQSVHNRARAYEYVNDAARLWQDLTIRLEGSEEIGQREAALNSRWQSFATGLLPQNQKLAGLTPINRELR